MFEFLLKYPWAMYRKGTFVFMSGWPVWLLGLLTAAAAGYLLWLFLRRREKWRGTARAAALAGLQCAVVAVLLLMLWQPALSVATLRAQQNVVAVVLDASSSMALEENGRKRIETARAALEGGLLAQIRAKYPVRFYTAGAGLKRVDNLEGVDAAESATRLGDTLKAAVGEASALPIGAIVLVSDGADNDGGLDQETIAALRAARLPVHTIGVGRTAPVNDIEVFSVQMPARALPGARLNAFVTVRQHGFAGGAATLTVREGEKTLATRQIRLEGDGKLSIEAIHFAAGETGARAFQFSVQPMEAETNRDNNAVTRIVNVENRRPRILYMEGEPRWEMKFIRRAAEEDQQLELVSLLRTTQNKIYRQGVADAQELVQGFPATVEEMFRYEALIIGSVEAAYFSGPQQALIREFADRRGGGVLFLGGRAALSEGGWQTTPAAEMMPVALPARKATFHRDPAKVELTARGADSLITRIEEQAPQNVARWKALPPLADYHETGAPKAGALVLAELITGAGRRMPLLATQNYGRGRVAVLATGGTWKWQMLQDSKDTSHERFWQQMLRWLAADTRGRVTALTSSTLISDAARIELRADVRDNNYLPLTDGSVEARVLGPGGLADSVPLLPDAQRQGQYAALWQASEPGSYLVEIVARRGEQEIGRDVATFRREDGVAENFRTEQNRELLERLSAQTGGRYFPVEAAAGLAEEIDFSEAGLSVRETHDLWDVPLLFLLLAGLKASEWFLRRCWGAV
jgi:uncharacterized membrane protein